MRILVIINYFQPKLGYHEYYLSKSLVKKGHKLIILTSDRFFPFPNYDKIYADYLGARKSPKVGFHKEYGLNVIRLPTLLEIGSNVFLLKQKNYIKKFKPDIVLIYGLFSPLLLFSIISIREIKSRKKDFAIIVSETMIPKFAKRNLFGCIKYIYLKLIFPVIFKFVRKFISAIYVTKEKVNDFLISNYKIKGYIIPLGVDINTFKPDYKMKTNPFTIFYSGKINKEKGVLDIIRIAGKLRKKYKIKLLFVGNATEKFKLEIMRLITIYDLNESFSWFPFTSQEKLAKYMKQGNIGLWIGKTPSASINEFISCGKPVLVRSFEGFDLEKLGYKFAIKYKNINQAIDIIERFIEDKNYYQNICKEARLYAIKFLDWDKIADKVLSLHIKDL